MATKGFKTIDEQIGILESRGLLIPEREIAANFLYRNNYYRISGYSLTLRKNDKFYKNVTFQNIIDIYEFDRGMRHILLKYIENIEVTIKSIYSYEFTKVLGPTGYIDENHFTDKKKYQEIIQKALNQEKARLPHELYLQHYVDELHEDLPLWAFVDLLTISDISFLYLISPEDIKKAVASAMGFIKPWILENFLHSMTIIRNICAHGGRLYNRIFAHKPSLNKKERKQLRNNKDGSIDVEHLYGFVLIMRRLLTKAEFQSMISEIIEITQKYPFVKMCYYGFREDWQALARE